MAPAIHVDYAEPNHMSKTVKKQKDTMMGKKTQGFSRGYSSGFVSDYRHAVDSMAESEGLGSSGRVEVDSDDSTAPKRKCISLNVDSSDGFGIPVELFSIAKMSRSERKQLEMRLRSDLDRVQNLQKRITLRSSNSVAMSSSSDIRSCSEGKKGPLSENMHKSLEYSSKQGNKKAPLVNDSHNLNRGNCGRFAPVKQENSGRFDSVKQEKLPTFPVSKLMEQCEALLKRVMIHEYGWVFNEPVDVVKLKIPDYFDVIKHPMDLGTVNRRILARQYADPWEFVADVRLTFSNAQTYNPPNNDVHIMAKTLSKYFEARWKNIQKKLPPINSMPMAAKQSVSKESKGPRTCSPSKKRKISSLHHGIRPEPVVKIEPVKRTMTDMDKQNLTRDVESLLDDVPQNIVDLLKEHSCKDDQDDPEDEVTVEIEALADDVLFTLRKLVDDYFEEKQRNATKVVPCEEVLNESGVSNSSMQHCKGNEPVDEDVDIGGNDPPTSSYPPVEIEKDTAHVRSKCSSPSSSGSDSSSSSSDSDSGSSSGSDSDDEKASSPVNRMKETHATSHGNSHDGNQSLIGLDQLEQKKPITVANSREEEGENPQPERPVSPDKLYRAAVMRNRFADTILKAREKTLLNQADNVDPEKLRREREELERLQREEKARLQAEAKAAEEARRKAEAEAAAEAAAETKRKRELEREAARLALQKMEKTVEINENCHFLESLEILGSSVVAVDAPVLADVTSEGPVAEESCVDEIGGFKLQGSNPLEQLGLYMKMDDDDEEEVEPSRVVVPDPAQDEDEDEDVEID